MSVPYRVWIKFNTATLEGFYAGAGTNQADWTDLYRSTCRLGAEAQSVYANRYWYSIFRPYADEKFEALVGMNQIVDVQFETILTKIRNELPITSVDLVQGFVDNENAWLYHIVSGKYYNGESAWDAYPPQQHASYNNPTIDISDGLKPWMMEHITTYFYSYKTGVGVEANRYQDDFFRGGAHFRLDNYVPSFPVPGKTGLFSLTPMIMVVRYFNPVVNECYVDGVKRDPLWVPTTGGVEFKLIGLGFKNEDSDLDGLGNSNPGGWDDLVDRIEFWKEQYAAMDFWRDDFNDSVIGGGWSTHETDANRTVVESGEVLTVGVAVDTDARWISSLNKAPKLYRDVPAKNTFEAVVKVNNFTLNDKIDVGIYIGYHTGVQGGLEAYRFMLRRYDGVGEGMQVFSHNGDNSDWDFTCDSGDLPIWMKIKVDAGVMSFWWSKDNSAWTQMRRLGAPWNVSGVFEQGMEIGLFASTDSATIHSGVQVPFEYIAIDQGGAPYATLIRADGDFTVDTNVQITIPSNKFPNLEVGSYILRVIKEGMDFSPRNPSEDVWGWAGDWRCTIGGLVSEGERIAIDARDAPPAEEPREKGGSIILMELSKKDLGGNITKEYWSFEDVRCPDKFYEGIITEVSSFRRGIDDKTGLFKVADCTVKMTNHDKKFSKLLATHIFKNQIATFYHAFIDEKEHDKREIVSMVVEDYNIQGTNFEIILKDVSQKYFKKNLPFLKATKKRFKNVHSDYEGDPLPDILGKSKYIGKEDKGAVEALYVNTVNYTYLAAGGKLHAITEVYSDNVLKIETTHYDIKYGDGFTFIKFNSDQEDKRITFNSEGYKNSAWDSENDYIQNPAYICCYVLMTLMGVPLDFVDYGSVEEMASLYVAMGMENSGKLIIAEDQQSAMEIFRELLFSFGMKCWISKEGKFTFGRKDMSAFSSDTIIFEQQDILDSLYRKMGLKSAVTRGKIEWDYIPAHDLYKASKDFPRDEEDNDEDEEDDIITSDDPLTPRRFRPLDDAVDVAPRAVGTTNSIAIMFNRAININRGNVIVYDSGDNVFETVKVTSDKVQIVGRLSRRVRINLTKDFKIGTSYYVQYGSKCFYDEELNYADAITDKTTWNFTVGAVTPDPDPPDDCRGGIRKIFRPIRFGEQIKEDNYGEIWICPKAVEDDDEGETIPTVVVDEDNSGDGTRDGVGSIDDRYDEGLEDSILRKRTRRF